MRTQFETLESQTPWPITKSYLHYQNVPLSGKLLYNWIPKKHPYTTGYLSLHSTKLTYPLLSSVTKKKKKTASDFHRSRILTRAAFSQILYLDPTLFSLYRLHHRRDIFWIFASPISHHIIHISHIFSPNPI